jgi:hypothetical protein
MAKALATDSLQPDIGKCRLQIACHLTDSRLALPLCAVKPCRIRKGDAFPVKKPADKKLCDEHG